MRELIITLIVLLVSISAFAADQPCNGIYLRAKGKPSPWFKSQDGQKVFLGKKQALMVPSMKKEASSPS